MLQCVNENANFALIKCENLPSPLGDCMIEKLNYRIQRGKTLSKSLCETTSIQLPKVDHLKNALEGFEEVIFSTKVGFPIEMKGKNIDEVKKNMLSFRLDLQKTFVKFKRNKSLKESLDEKLKAYCDLLKFHETTDCAILCLKGIRVTEDTYIKYSFGDSMNKISDSINMNQTAITIQKRATAFLRREKKIIDDYNSKRSKGLLVELIYAYTDKLNFSLHFAPHLKKKIIAIWKENTKVVARRIYGRDEKLEMKIDNVDSIQNAKVTVQNLAKKLRMGHVEMKPGHVGYDFDFVLHFGSDDPFITLESLIPNENLLGQIDAEVSTKTVFVVTKNVHAHEDGFISAFLAKYLHNSDKINILSTRGNKSDKILENGIGVFYDDQEENLFEISQNAKNIEGYENMKLFLVNKFEIKPYVKEITPVQWYVHVDERVCAGGPWYAEGENKKNSLPCTGCEKKSKSPLLHTFDSFCKVKCETCLHSRHAQHSTHSRKFCLPGTRKPMNNLSIEKWVFDEFIILLDKTHSSYELQKNDILIQTKTKCGSQHDYMAKLILCTSEYQNVFIDDGSGFKRYQQNELSKSFYSFTNKSNIADAISNCKVRQT